MADIKIAQLLKAGVHFGHKTPRWNPKMFPYIYMERNGIHILDLVQTSQLLQEACDFVQEAAEQRKTFLFVGTKPQAVEIIKDEAIRCESFYVNHRWYGGLLTNWQQLKYSVHAYKKFNSFISPIITKDIVAFPKYTKAKKRFDGIQNMVFKPDAILLLQATTAHKSIIEEAKRLKIPVIACVDSSSPTVSVEYPIPINTYSKAFCHFLCRLLVKIC